MMDMLEKKMKFMRTMAVWLMVALPTMWPELVTGNENLKELMERNMSSTHINMAGEESTLPSTDKNFHSAGAASTVIFNSHKPTQPWLAGLMADDLTTQSEFNSVITKSPSATIRAEDLINAVTTVPQVLTSAPPMHLSHPSTGASPTETSPSSKTSGNITKLPTVDREVPATSIYSASSSNISIATTSSPISMTDQDVSRIPEPLLTSVMTMTSFISSSKYTDDTAKDGNMGQTPTYQSSSTMTVLSKGITPTAGPNNNYIYIVIVVILLILLILVFCFVCLAKKKRRSGSTSFHGKKYKKNKGEDAWAGPVMIPEDPGMSAEEAEEGKDTDQPGKRHLTTFFAKRKSRQCSVLLEEVNVKADHLAKEEEKHFLNQEVNGQLTSNEKSNGAEDPSTSFTSEPKCGSELQPNGHVLTPEELVPEIQGESPDDLPSPVLMPAPETEFPLPPSELEMIPDDTDKAFTIKSSF
ncbi:leukosialin [Rhinatrema bivittatum]|uniref:leukosialin n=1 Tax=Rhinatrema bivittatum TaxID=194408 RepID=UPI00112D3875|nr:leukosialin [Rhinatrema bivittatum]